MVTLRPRALPGHAAMPPSNGRAGAALVLQTTKDLPVSLLVRLGGSSAPAITIWTVAFGWAATPGLLPRGLSAVSPMLPSARDRSSD